MRTPTRRLGRGLGAFLDLRPATDGGAAYAEGAFTSETDSVLETSAARPPAPAPVAQPLAQAPAAAVPAPPPPAPDDSPFIDDMVAPLTFTDVELD